MFLYPGIVQGQQQVRLGSLFLKHTLFFLFKNTWTKQTYITYPTPSLLVIFSYFTNVWIFSSSDWSLINLFQQTVYVHMYLHLLMLYS